MNDESATVRPDPEVIAVLAHLMEAFKGSDGRMIAVLPGEMRRRERPLFDRTISALSELGGMVNEETTVVAFPAGIDTDDIVAQLLECGEANPNSGGSTEVEPRPNDDLRG